MSEAQPNQHQRTLADTPFPGDAGEPDDEVRERLAASRTDSTGYLRAVAALCGVRLLVPVVARATDTTEEELTSDKEAEMAVVLLQAADGRKAMVAFTGLDTLEAWNPKARPVPVTLDVAAASARQDGASALLIDVEGPHPLAIDGAVLAELAAGHRLIEMPGQEFGWVQSAAE